MQFTRKSTKFLVKDEQDLQMRITIHTFLLSEELYNFFWIAFTTTILQNILSQFFVYVFNQKIYFLSAFILGFVSQSWISWSGELKTHDRWRVVKLLKFFCGVGCLFVEKIARLVKT